MIAFSELRKPKMRGEFRVQLIETLCFRGVNLFKLMADLVEEVVGQSLRPRAPDFSLLLSITL